MSYHNANNESGEQLVASELKAEKQEVIILDYFNKHDGEYSSEQIHNLFGVNVPLTSIRRALTNLYSDGKIIKCGQVKGKYGKMIYVWKRYNGLLF